NLAGVAGLFGPAGLTPSGPPAGRFNDAKLGAFDHGTRRITPADSSSPEGVIHPPSPQTRKARLPAGSCVVWLGWLDSNQPMAGSNPAAFPLGDTPTRNRKLA